jgi:cysteine sulfinate desulfinase/cysteine desulfurase-like protein
VASHVLLAMGLPMERASSAVRFSLGKQTSAEGIDDAAKAIERIIERLIKSNSAYAVA